jgi:FkbM family methyltransferase
MKNILNKSTEQIILDALILLTQGPSFPKTIVDVGANSNATISAPFIEDGWGTLLIEPQQSCIQLLLKKYGTYPNVDIVRCGCSNEESVQRLYYAKEGEGSELATFSQSDDPWMAMVRDNDRYEEISVYRLSDIVDTKPKFQDIGILKIDTESFDYNVLLGVDFGKHHPKVIITEEYLWNVDDVISKHRLLEKAGYICLGWSGYNTIWVCRVFFNLSWCDVELWPWLSKKNLISPPFDSLIGFHAIEELLDRSRYWDNCLSEMDLSISARSITCNPKAQAIVPVVISNYGSKPLPSLPQLNSGKKVFISYHIRDQNNYVLWDGIRTPLNDDIKSQKSTIMEMNFVAPDKPGQYQVEVDLVVDGETWFSSGTDKRPCCLTAIVSD